MKKMLFIRTEVHSNSNFETSKTNYSMQRGWTERMKYAFHKKCKYLIKPRTKTRARVRAICASYGISIV